MSQRFSIDSLVLDSSNIASVASQIHDMLALVATPDYDMLSQGIVDWPIFSVMYDDSCITIQLAQGDKELNGSFRMGTVLTFGEKPATKDFYLSYPSGKLTVSSTPSSPGIEWYDTALGLLEFNNQSAY